jgi:hypothetical protein
MSGWDLVSKQPFFKYAAVTVRAVAATSDRLGSGEPTVLAGRDDDGRHQERLGSEIRR